MAIRDRCGKTSRGTPARWAPTEATELDPRPVQQVRGRSLPASVVSVARPSRWGNPFQTGRDPDSRAAAVGQYAVWLAGRADLLAAARTDLCSRDLACDCPLEGSPCHRDVLLDIANPPANPVTAGGRVMGLTLRRPWASLMLIPEQLGGKSVENRSWSTDYRGPVAVYGGTQIDEAGSIAAARAGFDADWHADQSGWLGAAALVDVHPARGNCCPPWGHPEKPETPRHHWVFAGAARLALPTWGRGFLGLRPVSWSVLVRRNALELAGRPI